MRALCTYSSTVELGINLDSADHQRPSRLAGEIPPFCFGPVSSNPYHSRLVLRSESL